MSEKKIRLNLKNVTTVKVVKLKTIASIAIAEILWRQADIEKWIEELTQPGIFYQTSEHIDLNLEGDDYFTRIFYRRNIRRTYTCTTYHEYWERVIEAVLKNAKELLLPLEAEMCLTEMIMSTGENIRTIWGYPNDSCRRVNFEKYSFSSFGTLTTPCPSSLHHQELELIWKNQRTHEPYRFEFLNKLFGPRPKTIDHQLRYFDYICRINVNESAIKNYQSEIISHLDSLQPGLGALITCEEDIPFTIACVWTCLAHFAGREFIWKDWFQDEQARGYNYLLDFAFVQQNGLLITALSGKYFISKFHSLGLKIPNICIFHILNNILRHGLFCDELLRPFYGHVFVEQFLSSINLLSKNDRFAFVQKYPTEIVVLFLPIWPYQDMVPQILDFCLQHKLDLKYRFLMEYVMHFIGIENLSKRQIRKGFYLKIFQKIWNEASERIKLSFLISRVKARIREEIFKNPILKYRWGDRFSMKHLNYDDVIKSRCKEILQKSEDIFVDNFVRHLVIPSDERYRFYYACRACYYTNQNLNAVKFYLQLWQN